MNTPQSVEKPGRQHQSQSDSDSDLESKRSPPDKTRQTSPQKHDDESSEAVQVLDWDSSNSHLNPYTWTAQRKWLVTGTALFATLIVPLNGTSITIAAIEINAEFGISDASFPNSYWPMTSWSLGGALFVLIFLPLMEDLGVRRGFLLFYGLFILMIVPQALAQNFATLIATRFFSGGCTALLANTVSSVIPDLWQTDTARSVPVSVYIVLYEVGNTLGPPVFAGVMQHIGDWRWIFYIQLIIYAAFFPLFYLCLKETRGTVILREQAKRLRLKTGQPIYTRPELDPTPTHARLLRSTTRPLYLLLTEPVLFTSTLWSAFSFGAVFLFTQSVTYVFTTLYEWPEYQTGYIQTAIVLGELLGWLPTLYASHLYTRSSAHNPENPGRPIPEARLYVSVLGSFIGISGGMFVYAWTSYPSFHWLAPAIGLALVGAGITVVVSAVADYITDAYAASDYAASAISAVAAGENVMAAFLPLAAQQMYATMGLQWASSLLGFCALGLSFAPVVLIWYGRWFRERSPFMLAGRDEGGKKGSF